MVFHSCNEDNLKLLVDIGLAKVRGRLADRGVELVLSDEAKEFVIAKGFNPDYGARPLRRARAACTGPTSRTNRHSPMLAGSATRLR